MYRLAELSDSRRKTIGWGLLGLGFVGLVVAVIWIHYTSLPPEQDAGIFDWIPSNHLLKGVGYLVVFGASQMLVVGALFVWVLNQRMTWARALFASFVTWIELVIIFGMVPSEWLNFAQTDLDWSSQRVAVTIPACPGVGQRGTAQLGCHQGLDLDGLSPGDAGGRGGVRPTAAEDEERPACVGRQGTAPLTLRAAAGQG